jgi:hypothetical protein
MPLDGLKELVLDPLKRTDKDTYRIFLIIVSTNLGANRNFFIIDLDSPTQDGHRPLTYQAWEHNESSICFYYSS